METIILLAFIIGGSFPFVTAFVANDYQIAKRTVKVVKANLNRSKQIVPGIVTSEMVALEPRNKDWGPDGRLTQMWDDAFEYWQLEDPKGTLESYRIKQHEWEQERLALQKKISMGQEQYDVYIRGRGLGNINQAVEGKMMADQARRDLQSFGTGPTGLTHDERVVAGLAKRYGSEVFYNNDLVRLSSQKQMPTFDYIALTSV